MPMWTIAGGILLAVLALKIGAAVIDWLDIRTSRITDAEARRRARLTMEGKWPPPDTPSWKPVAWTWAVIAVLLTGWAYLQKWR